MSARVIGALHAQNNASYYLVAEINVKDQKAYEASGVDKVRDGMKANGTGKLIAGGYNKATAIDADSVANRVLIFRYPNIRGNGKRLEGQHRAVGDEARSA